MREKHSNQDHSHQNFSGQKLTGHHEGCDWSYSDLSYTEIYMTAPRNKFDYANMAYAKIKRLHDPDSTYKEVKFKKPLLHTAAHYLVGKWDILQSHSRISEIIRQWVIINIEPGKFQDRCFAYLDELARRKDLSWAELSRLESDEIITMGYFAFEEFPEIYERVIKHRPELEPEELKEEMAVKIGKNI